MKSAQLCLSLCLLGVSFIVVLSGGGFQIQKFFPMPAHTRDTLQLAMKKINSSLVGVCYGSGTSWSNYPYMASIRDEDNNACCSASIISLDPGILLTAAHCEPCNGTVRIGCNNPSNCTKGNSYKIQKFVAHPLYPGSSGVSYDIALIQLTTAITTDGAEVQYIPFPDFHRNIDNLRVVGYGITQTGDIPEELQTMEMEVIDYNMCQKIFEDALGKKIIDRTMICVRGGSPCEEKDPTTCSGDSGGPWNYGFAQMGITSWGLSGCDGGCNCCTQFPSVGVNVPFFANWIYGISAEWNNASTIITSTTTRN